jgi:hypothetical protein
MSRILKRPMFRKGGQVEEGVMSLASDGRAKYQDAGRVTMQDLIKDDPFLKDVYETAQAGYGRDVEQEKRDVLSNLLIRGGLGLVSGEGAGKGTLGAIATAFRGPTEQALAEMKGLKQDPAAMLTAKTAIEQKGAERLKLLDLQNKKLDAEKKARVMLGPDATADQIQKKAAQILEQREFGVEGRFEESAKIKRYENYREDLGLVGSAADEYDRFMQNRSKIEDNTGKPVRSVIKGDRTKSGKVDYTRKAKSKSGAPGIYIDPINGNYIEIRSDGSFEIIPDPLSGNQQMSMNDKAPPRIEEEVITEDTTELPGGDNPFAYIG